MTGSELAPRAIRLEDEFGRRLILRSLRFGEDDVETISRAMRGHRGSLGEDDLGRDRGGRLLNRVLEREEHRAVDLEQLDSVLGELIDLWTPQVTAEWWRSIGATGADDAVEGLALERQLAIRQAAEAQRVVRDCQAELGDDGRPRAD